MGGRTTRRAAAIVGAVLLAVSALAALGQAAKLRYWADLKTLEVCLWLPDIDAPFTEPPPRRRTPRSPWRR